MIMPRNIETDIADYFRLSPLVLPADWVQDNIDLSSDKVASSSGKVDLSLTPHLRDPLNFWAYPSRARMTIMAIEQTGKSSAWKWGLLWRTIFRPRPSLIVYESDDKAEKSNSTSFLPLMESIPSLASQLQRRGAICKDSFNFSDSVIYFCGGGSAITSYPLGIVIGDEVDEWKQYNEEVDNVRNLEKRIRTYKDGVMVLVCTPTKPAGVISREFGRSSQGFWHLRCRGCGNLTMRSCDIAGEFLDGQRRGGLQFELENERIIPDSLRLICPRCGREHTEAESPAMNQAGGYIHVHPELTKGVNAHFGFQWGALAANSFLVPGLSWIEIARAQLKAGKTGTFKDWLEFDGSWRGLPVRKRAMNGTQAATLLSHCQPLPDPGQIAFRLMSVDTQDAGFWAVVRGYEKIHYEIDGQGYDTLKSYLLGWTYCDSIEKLSDYWRQDFHGGRCVGGVIDEGGHRPEEARAFAKARANYYTYKGEGSSERVYGEKPQLSKNISRLILAREQFFRVSLLEAIYSESADMWQLPPDTTEESDYVKQILDYKPNIDEKTGVKKRGADEYPNWKSSGKDHLFDCEKMLLVLTAFKKRFEVAPPPAAQPKQVSTGQPRRSWVNSWR